MYKSASNNLDFKQQAKINYNQANQTLVLTGEWSWVCLDADFIFKQIATLQNQRLLLNGLQISYLDTTGAFFIHKLIELLKLSGNQIINVDLLKIDQSLLDMTAGLELKQNNPLNNVDKTTFVERLGAATLHFGATFKELVQFFGHLCVSMATLFKKGHSLYTQGIIDTISSAGIKGILISSLLCFLIGVNLTYQMSPQFVTYGANVYVVNFLGIALLREVTPLLTAIIVAGRTGSAITASIGTMKVQEEIDALQTMGISPVRRLVIPRVIGLLISLPILTMIADVASMLGGALVAATSLDVNYSLFLHRLQNYVSINNYTIGIVKTFAFAWIIAMVGCFCGFRVKGNADSIGVQTTRSVVMSICLIIFFDALFAILFKSLGM